MNIAKSEIDIQRIETLFEKISTLIEHARQHVYRTVNTAEVYTKFGIGRYIIEDEQQGNYRAAYGKAVLKGVSAKLTAKFGKGWSVESLTLCRKFYAVYSNFVNSVYEIHKHQEIKQQRISVTLFRKYGSPSSPSLGRTISS